MAADALAVRSTSAKKHKKSILLKTLHDKSSTMNLVHKAGRVKNADLSNVSDSPGHRNRTNMSGFYSPGKSTVKKQSLKFEFGGGSSSKFFENNMSSS